MAEKLQEKGIDISYEEVAENAGTTAIGRPHFAKILVEKGYVKKSQRHLTSILQREGHATLKEWELPLKMR